MTAPTLRVRVARRQRALGADGIVTRVRCPAEACMVGIVATVTAGSRELTLRAPAIDPASAHGVERIPGVGHQARLRAVRRAEERDLGAAISQRVGDGQRRNDVSRGSPRGYDDPWHR